MNYDLFFRAKHFDLRDFSTNFRLQAHPLIIINFILRKNINQDGEGGGGQILFGNLFKNKKKKKSKKQQKIRPYNYLLR